MSRFPALCSLATLVIALTAPPAHARTIKVSPGPGTPVQDAIALALPGDAIKLDAGSYPEAIVIDKPLRIFGRREATVIDGGCVADTAVRVAANGVTLKNLTVKGGSFYTVDIDNLDAVTVTKIAVVPSCADVQYGINVFQSTNLRIRGTRIEDPVSGYADAGIYIGGIPAEADVRVERSFMTAPNTRGIIVEDSNDSPTRPLGVRVRLNEITGSATGIFLHGSDSVEVSRNRVSGSSGPGIHADSSSNANTIASNVMSGNNPDVLDDGSNNCWRRNIFATGTVIPCP